MFIFAQEQFHWIDWPAVRDQGIPCVAQKSFGGTPGQDV